MIDQETREMIRREAAAQKAIAEGIHSTLEAWRQNANYRDIPLVNDLAAKEILAHKAWKSAALALDLLNAIEEGVSAKRIEIWESRVRAYAETLR